MTRAGGSGGLRARITYGRSLSAEVTLAEAREMLASAKRFERSKSSVYWLPFDPVTAKRILRERRDPDRLRRVVWHSGLVRTLAEDPEGLALLAAAGRQAEADGIAEVAGRLDETLCRIAREVKCGGKNKRGDKGDKDVKPSPGFAALLAAAEVRVAALAARVSKEGRETRLVVISVDEEGVERIRKVLPIDVGEAVELLQERIEQGESIGELPREELLRRWSTDPRPVVRVACVSLLRLDAGEAGEVSTDARVAEELFTDSASVVRTALLRRGFVPELLRPEWVEQLATKGTSDERLAAMDLVFSRTELAVRIRDFMSCEDLGTCVAYAARVRATICAAGRIRRMTKRLAWARVVAEDPEALLLRLGIGSEAPPGTLDDIVRKHEPWKVVRRRLFRRDALAALRLARAGVPWLDMEGVEGIAPYDASVYFGGLMPGA